MKNKLRREALEALKEIKGHDVEKNHIAADDILCRLLSGLGFADVVEEFEKIEKWYA